MRKTIFQDYAESIAHHISSAVEITAAVLIGLNFGSTVAVALELLLGADVIATAVAPTWDDIGKLAAIATIRTALNFFLERDLNNADR